MTLPEVASFTVSALFCVWYFMKKHWLANNALGLAFSIQGIEHISIGKLATGVGPDHKTLSIHISYLIL